MKIVVGGQIDKEDIAAIVKKELGDQAEVTVKGDLDATMGMKAGTYDYYVGACNTGGGGALAMAVANEVWMMENATYSILSPEGFASILWKDSKKAKEAAEVMKITAKDLLELGVVEQVIPEDIPACRDNLEELSKDMKSRMLEFLEKVEGMSGEELAAQRYDRFRKM